MSTHFKIDHDFDIDPEGYWQVFFEEGYMKDLYRELRIDFQVTEKTDDGKILRRVVKLRAQREIPAMFKSVVGDLSYTEVDTFDRARSSMQVAIEPAMMKDRFDMRGVYSVAPLGPGRSRRTFEGDAKVSVALIGGKIEKYMVDEIRASYDVAARITRDWVTRRKQSA
ncbi:MAG TPA: DUF2505 domain-containing protein [Polyangia bacterium]|jgi:hypothetical protein|nr:DUF2505 domain-containing protein [Polyangia bacterium]